ncbi:hypothetical protein [Kamptonema formosum]|uniref:hypothetical protein n=1 Tax=Kamptonema formosum TaxID=331992 RepID=UPI00034DB4DD|nr:hypothetical protein [Oscillatoria sp. PCC 10802]
MFVKSCHYEELLAEYSNSLSAIALLKQYRPYLEMIPSLRRPDESVIAIPLPNVRIRHEVSNSTSIQAGTVEVIELPCDVVILMCDPEWKIKTGAEIMIFIHRPHEDFSDLLRRWRQTEIFLSKNYDWLMPHRYKYILSEGAEQIYPLFVVFAETPERIKRGLKGAALPFVVQTLGSSLEQEPSEEIFTGQQ